MVMIMSYCKKSFEEYIDFIENKLGVKLFEFQKQLLRETYECKYYYHYAPGRLYGLSILREAMKILMEQMEKENQNGD